MFVLRAPGDTLVKKNLIVPFLVLIAFAAVVFLRGGGSRAPVPEVFAAGLTFEEAQTEAAASGKPVFALVTADWCGPCQSLKRGALSDPRVVDLIRANAVPVYLEEATAMTHIQALGVRAYPTAVILRDGQVEQMIEGGASPDNYLRTLRAALGVEG